MNKKLYVAGAGAGKTTLLINEALKIKNKQILITTFTEENEKSIKQKFIKLNRCIPQNVIIQTWFSFLLEHCVRPFQGAMGLYDFDCTGLVLVNGISAQYVKESETIKHYFSLEGKIYSDKISKFAINCNLKSGNKIIDRLSSIYQHIFIDEIQDLAGDDLELIKLIFKSKINMILVGDPRQGTYSTNNSKKNKKYQKSKIINFFEEHITDLEKDALTLSVNYRCHPNICALANKLYPEFPMVKPYHQVDNEHIGLNFIKIGQLTEHLERYKAIQLRYNKVCKNINADYPVMNFGQAKGLEFDNVVIFPTSEMLKWFKDHNTELKPETKAKLYVAITRARYNLAVLY